MLRVRRDIIAGKQPAAWFVPSGRNPRVVPSLRERTLLCFSWTEHAQFGFSHYPAVFLSCTMDGLAVSEICVFPARDTFVVYFTPTLRPFPSSSLFVPLLQLTRFYWDVWLHDLHRRGDCRRATFGDFFRKPLLRSVDLHEEIILAFRDQQIKDQELFTAMDDTPAELKETCKEMFCLDFVKDRFAHKREWANIHKAWLQVKVYGEVRVKVDAVPRALGQPISFLTADRAYLVVQVKPKFGVQNSHPRVNTTRSRNGYMMAPSKQNGSITWSGWRQIASRSAQKTWASDANGDEPGRVADSSHLEAFHVGPRPVLDSPADLSKDTFNDFLEELLSDDIVLMNREIDNEVWAATQWAHCMECEYQSRREGVRL